MERGPWICHRLKREDLLLAEKETVGLRGEGATTERELEVRSVQS